MAARVPAGPRRLRPGTIAGATTSGTLVDRRQGRSLVPAPVPAVDVRRADGRFETHIDWLHSRHSFSFGPHRDPRNTHFGLLLVNNDDRVAPDTGFDTHPHRDMEIVTWVLEGELEHRDSEGHTGVLYPGLAQRMSAGPGSCTPR
jgi:hypothetical protein